MKKEEHFESNEIREEKLNGFVPVQYKILKFDAKFIINSTEPKREVPKKKGTGVDKYYQVKEISLEDWLRQAHGNSGLISVSDCFLFQKIREVNGKSDGTPIWDQQYKAYKKLKQYRDNIKQLKKKAQAEPKTENIEAVEKEIFKMENFLFVPEIINVESSTKSEYSKFAGKGFYYGDYKYVRRSAGSGNLKKNTVTFIREEIADEIKHKLHVNFQVNVEENAILAPSKFGAYDGLSTSGVTFVKPPRVVVVPDFEYITFKDKNNKEHNCYYVTKTGGNKSLDPKNPDAVEYDIDIRPFYETKEEGAVLNSFDGMGLISHDFAETEWKQNLHINYLPSAFIVRSLGVKGLLVTFPFKDFAKKNGFQSICDIRYKNCPDDDRKYVPIDEVNVILTESQWKYKKLYADNSGKLGYDFSYYEQSSEAIWGVQRYAPNPKDEKDIARFNYQMVQTSNITEDEDIDKVVAPTEEYLRLLAEGKPEYILYALLKEAKNKKYETENEEEIDEDLEDVEPAESDDEEASTDSASSEDEYELLNTTTLNNVIYKNYELINDAYVKNEIHKYIKSILNRAKSGKLYPEHCSNYQFMISDPYALAQWAFKWVEWIDDGNVDEQIGLIPPNFVYSNYWLKKGVDKVDACRSPMTDIAEHNVLSVCNKENIKSDVFSEMETYYRYIKSGIIYSLHDLSTLKHSDSDWDGDIVMTTDSPTFINNAWSVMPTTYDKGVDKLGKNEGAVEDRPEQPYTIDNAVKSDKDGFGNKVGTYSNMSTSLFAMLPLFRNDEKQEEKDYSEYDCTQGQLEIFKKVKKLRYIIGEEIDSTKTGQKPELSREFDKRSNTTDSSENRRSSQEKIEETANKYLECNKFTPRYMPYFFIYVRDNYKDKYTKYKMRMNEACKWLTHESIDNFTSGIMQRTRTIETEGEKKFWEYYESHSPLLLTDCLMNRICWKLERLENELEAKIKAKWGKKDDYILMSYASPITVTKAQKEFIIEQYNYYIKEKQRIFSKKNKNNNVSEGKLWSVGRKEVLIYDVRKRLNEELKVGYKDLFNMLVKALKKLEKSKYNSINSFLWDVMGDDILDVIPLNQTYLVWDDTGSPEESGNVEILGKNVVFEWRKRKIEV